MSILEKEGIIRKNLNGSWNKRDLRKVWSFVVTGGLK
jgi:hypothetical protein